MSILTDFLQSQPDVKKGTISASQWLEKASGNADKCEWATHVGKFTEPNILGVNADIQRKVPKQDGYIYTANVEYKKDLIGGAAFSPTLKLLSLALEDGKTVFDHFKEDSELIHKEIESLSLDYKPIRINILKTKEGNIPKKTDTYIKQVYFPVDGSEEYHLLSVLPSSCLLLELSERLRDIVHDAAEARNEKSDDYGKPHQQMYDLTYICVGSGHAQNISYLNNKSNGMSFLLPSFPPGFAKKSVNLPHTNFFHSLHLKRFEDLFKRFHKHLVRKQNNKDAESRLRAVEETIVDEVLWFVYRLRALSLKWSDAENIKISMSQKIWLDEQYVEQREKSSEWKDEIADDFTRWMLFSAYKRILKSKALEFNDVEFVALRERIKNLLQ